MANNDPYGQYQIVKNYILNSKALYGTQGWATYANTPGTTPTTGTGGTAASITFTQSTTSALANGTSFVLSKTGAANPQGEGASYDFTIDTASASKVLQVSFDYLCAAGTFTAGSSGVDSSIVVYLYDVTNAVLIQPSTYKLYANSATVSAQFVGNFQSNYNSTSYRLIFHCGTTATATFDLKIDNVTVAPTVYTYGTPITDNISYTPSFGAGFGSVTNIKVFYQRIGDSLRLYGTCTLGTVSAAVGSISLPSGLSIDTTKITIGNTTSNAGCEVGKYFNNGGVSQFGPLVTATGTSTTLIYMAPVTTASGMLVPTSSVSTYMSSNAVFSFDALVPILGWSSCVQTSDQTTQQVVAAIVTGAVQSSYTGGTAIIWPTVSKDTTGSYNASTGVYTVATPGFYNITATLNTNCAGSQRLYATINGTEQAPALTFSTSAGLFSGTTMVYANAGQTIDVRCQTAWTLAVSTSSGLAIERVSGPASIAASEKVFAQYFMSSNQGVTANVTVLNLDSKIVDSHGSVTTGASPNWKFTAPRAGTYTFTFKAKASAAFGMNFYKNGSQLDFMLVGRTAGDPYPWANTFYLNAGDYCYFISDSNVTITGSASAPYGTIFSVIGY